MNSKLQPIAAMDVPADVSTPKSGSPLRTSEILRNILADNPRAKTFSVEQLVSAIGHDHFDVSLLMFSIPAMVPVPQPRGMVTVPLGTIACQMAAGFKEIKLPRFVLERAISRKALAVAIHALLPALEAAEKTIRPRWLWVNHSVSRRVVSLFLVLLAISLAFPLFGFTSLHATSVFIIALGMAEKDGLAVMVGIVAGVLSLALVLASGVSVRALRAKAGAWLRKVGRKLGLARLASFLERHGYKRLARALRFEWSQLLLRWDPERRDRLRARRARRAAAMVITAVSPANDATVSTMASAE